MASMKKNMLSAQGVKATALVIELLPSLWSQGELIWNSTLSHSHLTLFGTQFLPCGSLPTKAIGLKMVVNYMVELFIGSSLDVLYGYSSP